MLWHKAIGAGGIGGLRPYPGVGAIVFDQQVAAPTSGLRDIYIRPGGSEITTISYGNTGLGYQYSLGSPFNLATIGGQVGAAALQYVPSIDFVDDGTKLYFPQFDLLRVLVLNVQTPYRYPSTYSQFSVESTGSGVYPLHGRMKPDGLRFWWNRAATNELYQRDLDANRAFEVAYSTTTRAQAYTVTGSVSGWDINSTGEYILMADTAGLLRQYTLTTPFDIETMTSPVTLDISANVAEPYSVRFAEDGNCVMVLDRVANTITKYRW